MKTITTIPETMHVVNLHGVGELVYEERKVPGLKQGEVLLQVKACGICSSDEERVYVTGTYHFPTIPGHEFAGQIVAVNDDVDESLLGRKASVFPLLPCRKCHSCKKEDYPLCSDYNYFGSRCDGAYAEYLAVPVWNLVLQDDSVDYKVAAMSEPAAVALHAANIGGVKRGDKVAVIGTGTIGILIGAFCRIKGAEVYICGRRKESMEFAQSLGFATCSVNDMEREVMARTDGIGMDVVLEAVGTNEALTQAILGVKNSGTIVAVGNPKGDLHIEKGIYWRILRRQITVKGTWNSNYKASDNDWDKVARLMKEGDFPFERLITRTYRLSEFQEAFDFLRDKSVPKAKVMFVNE